MPSLGVTDPFRWIRRRCRAPVRPRVGWIIDWTQQRRRQARAEGVAVDELGAFDDFSHLYEVATSSAPDPREEKMRALRQYMNSIEQRGGQNEGGSKRKRRSALVKDGC